MITVALKRLRLNLLVVLQLLQQVKLEKGTIINHQLLDGMACIAPLSVQVFQLASVTPQTNARCMLALRTIPYNQREN